MNRTKIEWCDRTWNPAVGCYGPGGTKEKPNRCFYCYGMGLAKRGFLKDNPNYEPKFYPERLKEHYMNLINLKITKSLIKSRIKKGWKSKELNDPIRIFVCSVAGLFGDWVSRENIEKVIKVVKDNPQCTFQFLTKNPKRYSEFEFPKNCWLGTTIDYPNQTRLDYLRKKKDNYKFVSFEPLLGDMSKLKGLTEIDLAIVGAMTGMKKQNIVPEKKWIDSIKHANIFYKTNIKEYL